VAAVYRSDLVYAQPLCAGDDRGVDSTDRKVTVSADEVGYSQSVDGVNWLYVKGAGRHVTEKLQLGLSAQAGSKQVDNLGNDTASRATAKSCPPSGIGNSVTLSP
jgi:hypothetical protein